MRQQFFFIVTASACFGGAKGRVLIITQWSIKVNQDYAWLGQRFGRYFPLRSRILLYIVYKQKKGFAVRCSFHKALGTLIG
jgi:hypothetical protein